MLNVRVLEESTVRASNGIVCINRGVMVKDSREIKRDILEGFHGYV